MSDRSPWEEHEAALAARWFQQAESGVKTTYVYRYYDAAGHMLYVGQTCNLDRRHSGHKTKAIWFDEVERREVVGPFAKDVALALEFHAIDTERPIYNAHAGNGYRGPGSIHWMEDMAAAYWERMRSDADFAERQGAWMADRLNSLFSGAEVAS